MKFCCLLSCLIVGIVPALEASRTTPQAASSSSSKQPKKSPPVATAELEPGSVGNGVYRNKSLGLSFKIPAGWVLRTDEINSETAETAKSEKDPSGAERASSAGSKLLLAAFSRPPEARGEDVNSSIVIAAEALTSYPGLKLPEQYFEPLTEVAKAQSFTVDGEPYETAIGTKTLVRGDFHKNVGTRVMRQTSLVMLAHGYAVSVTVIGGTENEVEELIEGLDFGVGAK